MILVDDRVLTPEQQEFAEQHHGLLLKFMVTYGLTDDDYGILAERYTRSGLVKLPALRCSSA